MKRRIIAIDFDDTIAVDSDYPITGHLSKTAAKYIHKLNEKGYELVLWTARLESSFKEAKMLVNCWKLPINIDNPSYPHGVTGKLQADFYIDDKSYPGKLNWRKIYKYICKKFPL